MSQVLRNFLVILLVAQTFYGLAQSPDDLLRSKVNLYSNSSVQLIFPNFGSCSGNVIAHNTNEEDVLYILSSAHCLPDPIPNSVTVLFGNNSILESAPEIKSLTAVTVVPCTVLAKNSSLDFVLYRIDLTDEINLPVYQLGWQASFQVPTYAFSFHHPGGQSLNYDLKRTGVKVGTFPVTPEVPNPYENGFWSVPQGDADFSFESGSSGSVLINQDGEALGSLVGASYSTTDTTLFFNRFDLCYNTFTESSNQLAYWIDPMLQSKAQGAYANVEKLDNYYYSHKLVGLDSLRRDNEVEIPFNLSQGGYLYGFILPIAKTKVEGGEQLQIGIRFKGESEFAKIESYPVTQLQAFRENQFLFSNPLLVDRSFNIRIWIEEFSDSSFIELPKVSFERNNGVGSQYVNPASILSDQLEINTSYNFGTWLNAFPNPAKTNLFLTPFSENGKIMVVDIQGSKKNVAYSIINNEAVLDVESLATGIYFIIIQNSEANPSVVRFLKE